MAKGAAFYKKNSGYKQLKNMLAVRYGGDLANRVYEFAGQELDRMYFEYTEVPANVQQHVYKYIFPRVAMYHGMKQEIGEDALPVLEEFIKATGEKMSKKLDRLISFPGMLGPAMKAFARVSRNNFGKKSGFGQTFYEASKDCVKFDITDCPYCKYCTLCGCKELIHTFCDSDIYMYGNLTKISFERTETLEKGKKCDFTFRRK